MQKAVGHTNAPHPELETELQEEIAKIEPKVVKGTVTVEEANRLHSLEARAHGHTERGGITSIAQSVAAKRERQLSLSSSSSPPSNRSRANSKAFTPEEQSHRDKEANLKIAEMSLESKLEKKPEKVTKEDTSHVQSREQRAHGHVDKGGMAAQAMASAHKRQMSQPTVEVN
jgi:predicted  nucleic acid-binding Zn-ribbon protein